MARATSPRGSWSWELRNSKPEDLSPKPSNHLGSIGFDGVLTGLWERFYGVLMAFERVLLKTGSVQGLDRVAIRF